MPSTVSWLLPGDALIENPVSAAAARLAIAAARMLTLGTWVM
jgi:hypothetical protein